MESERALDTRQGSGALPKVRYLQIAGRYGVPTDAAMTSLSVVVVDPAAAGFVTVWPCRSVAETPPTVSSLNYGPGWIRANNVVTTLNPLGGVCLYSHTPTDLVVDVQGWTQSESVVAVDPVRLLDSRSTSRFAAGEVRRITVPGGRDAAAAFVNVTAVSDGNPGFVAVYPCASTSAPTPSTSTVNAVPSGVVANAAVVGLTSGGFCVRTSHSMNVVIDLNGLVTPEVVGLSFPGEFRLADTRTGFVASAASGPTRLRARTTAEFTVAGRGTVPADAVGVVVNVTAVSPGGSGFITVWPCGSASERPPTVSMVNFTPDWLATPAMGFQELNDRGSFCVYSSTDVDAVIDVIAVLS